MLAIRALRRIPRNPDLLTAYTVQPVMFTLLFVFVFGGAIPTPGYDDYADFLIPGIIVQPMSFGGFATALGLVDDLQKGLDRPVSLLTDVAHGGAHRADTLRHCDERPRPGGDDRRRLHRRLLVQHLGGRGDRRDRALPADRLRLLLGLRLRRVLASTPEAANAFGFIAIFPLTFASSAFVPPETMPDWLQTFATDINPFSIMVDAVRSLFVGGPGGEDVLPASSGASG